MAPENKMEYIYTCLHCYKVSKVPVVKGRLHCQFCKGSSKFSLDDEPKVDEEEVEDGLVDMDSLPDDIPEDAMVVTMDELMALIDSGEIELDDDTLAQLEDLVAQYEELDDEEE